MATDSNTPHIESWSDYVGAIVTWLISLPGVKEAFAMAITRVVLTVLHRRQVDPEYAAKADAAGMAFHMARTNEERQNAQKLLQSLDAMPGA